MAVERGRWWRRGIPAGYSLVLALLILAPLLPPGYLLLRDAVSTPRSYLTDSALGLGDAAPRAVPQDALLAVLSPIVDGGLLVKAILLVALWAAGCGAARLVRELLDAGLPGQLAAATLAVWNPYVAERLLQGHWSLLVGYAALPWTVLAAARLRTGRSEAVSASNPLLPAAEGTGAGGDRARRGPASVLPGSFDGWASSFGDWAVLAGCLAAAGLTPTGGVLASVVALVVAGVRRGPGVLALSVLAWCPWLVATAVSGVATEPSDPAGVAAFAARAEPALGTLGALAGLGGIWNADAVPDSRTTFLAAVATGVLLIIVALGIRTVLATDIAPEYAGIRRNVLALAAAAIVLPALAATEPGMAVMEWLVTEIPGTGLLRDTQKYVALAVPAYMLCAAAVCRRRVQASGGRSGTSIVAALVVITALVVPLLDLAWGVGGQVRAVRYPDSWHEVARRIDGPGDIAVLPGGMFRRFPYSGSAPVLDPAPRMLPNDVLQTGELPVRGRTVTGEGTRARRVEDLLLSGGSPHDLARLGVGWILVEHTTPGPLGNSATTLAQLTPVHTTGDLTLYKIPDPHLRPPAPHRNLVIAAHLVWAALLLLPLLSGGRAVLRRGGRGRLRGRSDR